MANNEHYSPDPSTGLPKVSPAAVEAYKKQQPRNFEQDLSQLTTHHPAVAQEFLEALYSIDPQLRELQRCFAQGALFLYTLLDGVVQAQQLEQLLSANTPSAETTLTGLPEVSTAAVEVYKSTPHPPEYELEKLRRHNPAIAHELVAGVSGVDPRFLNQRRAFARGALYMYSLLDGASETRQLEEMLHQEPPSDDGGGEGQPLLV